MNIHIAVAPGIELKEYSNKTKFWPVLKGYYLPDGVVEIRCPCETIDGLPYPHLPCGITGRCVLELTMSSRYTHHAIFLLIGAVGDEPQFALTEIRKGSAPKPWLVMA